jgi:winged helix DNA-binding protein
VPPRILSARELNRALLARQLLLERVRQPVPTVVERMGEVQSQYAPSAYIGLWSRIDGLPRERVDEALVTKRIVQGTLMRSTIHLVSRRDYAPLAAGVRRARREWWLRVARRRDDRPLRRAAERVRAALADGPRTRAELVREVGDDPQVWNGVGLWVDLVRVPPSGTWARRRADLFATAEWWLGEAADVPEEEGLRRLATRYLAAFGPGTTRDLSSWAGVPTAIFGPVLAAMRLRRFRDDRGDELLDLPGAPLPEGDVPAPVRLLGTYDAMLLAHARRTEVLPERHRERVFNIRLPHSVCSFLVDGRVAGSWRVAEGRVEVEPFEPLSRATRAALDEELDRVLDLYR